MVKLSPGDRFTYHPSDGLLLVLCDTSSESMTVALPDVGAVTNNPLVVKSLGENNVTITPVSGQTIDGAASLVLSGGIYDAVVLCRDGVKSWHAVLRYQRAGVIDIDGNVYDTVVVGNQEWIVQNFKCTKLNDGTEIPDVTNDGEWGALATIGRCVYGNDPENASIYGLLYNWYVVNTGKLAPDGWRIPSRTDWETLANYLGGQSVAGGKLKEIGDAHWVSPNVGATNEVGFNGLPGGCRYNGIGWFAELGYSGYYWMNHYDGNPFGRTLVNSNGELGSVTFMGDSYGASIRLVRDRI